MAPAPQEMSGKFAAVAPGYHEDSVVISGMSGTYPNCLHLEDLSNILYKKIDPLSEPKLRWDYSHPEVPPYAGTVPDLDRFDAQFFKVSNQLARNMDPMARKLMENVYRAIYDAGLSADHLSGQNIGVFIGASLAEVEKSLYYDIDHLSSTSLPGCSKSMFANRISYWLNVRGPSMLIDDSCASSLDALEQALRAIRRGDCEAAIVGGANVTLHPQTVVHCGRIIPLCKDGKTKSYDRNADGCVKSDAICVFFLQKVQNALRIYAEVVHVKNEYELALEDSRTLKGLYRDPKDLADFMKVFYKEANVSPHDIEYVEGFGSGAPEVDKAELEVAGEVFCKDRSNPLLVGSVTSNIGYTEAASGLCSVTKVLLGYQKGILAANLHCPNPRQDVAALRDGRMRIVTEHAPFHRTYAAVNGFSVTGVNCHVLLRGCYKPKKNTFKLGIGRLVTISGRQESAVKKIINHLSKRAIDAEELALLHNIHEEKSSGHLGRGFAILDSKADGETVCLSSSVDQFDDVKRPLWFVYSGMGSQWPGMGKELLRIPVFAAAIERCHKVLKPKGLDIVHIITTRDKTIFDNILHSFIGIAAVQIGLTDALREMGIVPDKIIGHSVGELGCGYADGCLSAEEVILSAYSRGLVSLQTEFIRGSMAAVGIGYERIVKLCPPEIDVACHNGPDSCTISGPADVMREFVGKLSAQGVFAKEVPCSNIAYHSRYIAEAGPKLLDYLSDVIKAPKRRSERWVSTSVPQDRWSKENAQFCSAWYHTNNLLSPVLFEESSRLVPEGAVLLEIAPHGLLQPILKRSLHPDCRHVALTQRGHADGSLFFLEAIGKLYMQGFNPRIKNIYPKVQFPVSTETPGLSHLVELNRGEKWTVSKFKSVKKERATICTSLISIHDSESSYLRGNVLRGKNLYPFSAVLIAVWDTLAMTSGVARTELSVQFRDVHLYAQPLLHDNRPLQIKVTIQKGTGEFEVVSLISRVATGNISKYTEKLPPYKHTAYEKTILHSEHIYKLFQEKDYSYSGEFCSIFKSDYSFMEADLLWNDNWVTLIDGMLQLNSLKRDHETISQPKYVYNLIIDQKTHCEYKTVLDDNTFIPTVSSVVCDYTRCGGILIEKVKFYDFPLLDNQTLELRILDSFSQNQSEILNINNVTLQSEKFGALNSLYWKGSNDMISPSSSELLVKVKYAGISVYDVNVATGAYSSKLGYLGRNVYGMEYSGTTDTGSRVMGLVRGGAARARVCGARALAWPVPAHWTMQDAATVPLAYACAFYCLGIRAPLLPGMTILVHGGSGALGQAVISIALAHRCRVFSTVADDHKKKFLVKLFPDLTEDDIGYSRDDSFAELVLRATDGEGCDIIISCATGNIKNATLKCASFCGITFDVEQAHSEDTFAYGMSFMTRQRAYALVNFFSIFEEENMQTLQLMMSEGIARGYVRPLSRVSFAAHESTRAFRLLAARQHRGRVLLRLPSNITPALGSPQGILNVDKKHNSRTSLLENIADKADITLPDNIGEGTTLQEMGLKNCYVKSIRTFLHYGYHVSITDEKIPKLTVKLLREIDDGSKEPEFKETVGLSALFSHVDHDEHRGTAKMVVLPTLVKSETVLCITISHGEHWRGNPLGDGEIDLSWQYLCIVPGAEGHHERFRPLCARLQLPALVLQPPAHALRDTVQQTALRYVKILTAKTNLKKNNDFYLLGYETGVLIAIEMAAILEKEGLTGTVFCIGGRPEEVLLYVENNLKHLYTEEKLQNALIYHMVSLMATETIDNTDTLWQKGLSLKDKLDKSLRVLMKNVPQTTPYVRSVIEAAYARIQQALHYKVQAQTLRSRIILLRTSSTDSVDNVEILSQEPITSHDIVVPLMHATKHPRCASIINSHLSTNILETYKLQNHCETFTHVTGVYYPNNDDE